MSEHFDVLSSIRALINATPLDKQPGRARDGDEWTRDRVGASVEVDTLHRENRALKGDLDRVKAELSQAKTRLSTDTTEVSHQRKVLIQADEAIVQLKSEVGSLKREIQNQANVIRSEKQSRQQAENNFQSSKVQQSQLAKDRNELDTQVKGLRMALEKAEGRVRHLDGVNANLTNEIRALQLKCKAAEDQLKHVRLQNDALRLQVESHHHKESIYPTHPTPPRPLRDKGATPILPDTTTVPSPTTLELLRVHDLPERLRPYELILRYITDNLPAILDFLPELIRAVQLIVDAASAGRRRRPHSGTSVGDVSRCRGGTRGPDRRTEAGADGEQADAEQKLMADKANLKSIIREREREINKLLDKNESLKRQNNAYVEEFKEQERASQHQSRRKRERAALAAHQPVLVPDPPEKLARREAPASPSSPLIGHDALSPSLDQLARELGRQTIKDDPFANLDQAFAVAEEIVDFGGRDQATAAWSSPEQSSLDFMYGGAKI